MQRSSHHVVARDFVGLTDRKFNTPLPHKRLSHISSHHDDEALDVGTACVRRSYSISNSVPRLLSMHQSPSLILDITSSYVRGHNGQLYRWRPELGVRLSESDATGDVYDYAQSGINHVQQNWNGSYPACGSSSDTQSSQYYPYQQQ
jgi:hypothetical protein